MVLWLVSIKCLTRRVGVTTTICLFGDEIQRRNIFLLPNIYRRRQTILFVTKYKSQATKFIFHRLIVKHKLHMATNNYFRHLKVKKMLQNNGGKLATKYFVTKNISFLDLHSVWEEGKEWNGKRKIKLNNILSFSLFGSLSKREWKDHSLVWEFK